MRESNAPLAVSLRSYSQGEKNLWQYWHKASNKFGFVDYKFKTLDLAGSKPTTSSFELSCIGQYDTIASRNHFGYEEFFNFN